MMKTKKYTLIELLISMGIFAVMMLLLLNFFSKYQDFTYMASARNDALSTANTLFAQLEKDLRSSVTYTKLKPNGGDALASSLDINVSANEITFASHCRLSGTTTSTDTGSGGLALLKYFIPADETNVKRGFKDIIGEDLSTVKPSFSGDLGDYVAEGVTKLSFVAYETKTDFLNGTASVNNSFYYNAPASKYPIYAIMCTISIKDPNPSANPLKTVRDLQKIILLTP
jgi:type II secretory pathway pseudopilin PulG